MRHSSALFHADGNRDHLATPDGLRERDGILELCEIKTTVTKWRGFPRHYLRQIWWQQYVLGAERTLVVWERHEDSSLSTRTPSAAGSTGTRTRSTGSTSCRGSAARAEAEPGSRK